MAENEKFEKYKEIKKEIATNYRGYALEKIIALDLIVEVYVKRKFTVKSFFSFIIKHRLPLFFSSLNIEKLNINEPSKTLFSMGIYERKDYYEIWEYAKSHVDNHLSFDFSNENNIKKFNINNIIRAWKMFGKTNRLGLLAKFNLAAKLAFYLNIIDDLEQTAPIAGKYCAFSSVHEHETILTLYFKKKGIPTYGLQHGLYTVFTRDIPFDAILYENFVSDYHLCWGQSTKDEFSGYGINSDSLIVAGYTRNIQRPSAPRKLNKKSCLVLLARFTYHETNMRLFEILKTISEKYKISFHLKLHPSLYMAEYYPYYQTITEENNWILVAQETTVLGLLKEGGFGWSISVNTSAYYEAYIQYLPSLRFNDGTFENMVDVMQDDFSNQKELEERLSQIPFNDTNSLRNYCKKVDEQLDYAIGINIDEYNCLNV